MIAASCRYSKIDQTDHVGIGPNVISNILKIQVTARSPMCELHRALKLSREGE
jgi:hypothetical protein